MRNLDTISVLEACETALDLPSTERETWLAAQHGHQPEMVEACRRRAAEAGVQNVEVIRSDAAHVPLPDATAELVLIAWVLHEVPDRVALLREARRLLDPFGQFVSPVLGVEECVVEVAGAEVEDGGGSEFGCEEPGEAFSACLTGFVGVEGDYEWVG